MISRSRNAGFTLMEMIIAMTVLAIIGVIGSDVIANGMQAAIYANDKTRLSAKLNYAMDRMTRDVREMMISSSAYQLTVNASGTGNAYATSITFTKRDPVQTSATGPTNNVTLATSSGQIAMTFVSSASVTTNTYLTDSVSDLKFYFYDVNGNAILTNSSSLTTDMRYVEIDLTLLDSATNTSYRDVTRVALRNAS